ncbi:MAG TPA: hypothetical protein VKR60_05160 [Candidatus Sulfotelmatobacter sp.]|nr:hypothetical protein [Candidatus Sulfotelmatobacter sp.]
MTNKKLIVGALSLVATVLLATASFAATPCSSGIDVHYVGIGSSAEFETLAFGANKAIANLPTYTAPTNIWSNASAQIIDARTGVNTIDAGIKVWVFYDSSATCNVYVGYQADSVQGNKDFFCYGKVASGFVGIEANCYGNHETTGSWELANSGGNVIFGLPDVPAATPLPTPISTFLVTAPVPTKVGSKQALPPAYCGQTGTVGSKTAYCYFNVAHTDIRPEDGLYATTRALSSYNTTNGMSGLGYNQAACGATGSGTKTVGCPVYDSFAKKAVFYALNFSLTKNDPYTGAAVPGYTTLSIGATPAVVMVNNADTANLGFGATNPDGSYLHKNIRHKVLAHIFDGTDSCTGDVLATTPTPSAFGGSIAGSGQPIQVVIREPLSGTYNTFEFTAVRTLSGSAAVAVNQSKIKSTTWISDDQSSQEIDLRGNLGALGPAFNFGTGSACPGNSNAAPDGTADCGDPLLVHTSTCGTGTTKGLHLRAIGTGEEVAATMGQDNTGGSQVVDGMGFTFWSYANLKPGASGCSGTGTSGDVTCSTYNGHYLTVDGIDPLFATEGGQGFGGTVENPTGAYNFPQCGLIQKVAGYTFPCQQIPFTHIYDGTYPLWTMLRLVTFDNVGTTQVTPEGVINVLAYAQSEAAPGSAEQLSDFVPFLSSITGLPYSQGGTLPSGDLNLGVFRSHYVQSGVNPDNGHVACAGTFTGVNITGGTKGSKTCLVDLGGDVGGSVVTVQSDVDFHADFGSQTTEIYGLHQ